MFADKRNHTKETKASTKSERRNIAYFRTFSEQEKNTGRAVMSHFREKDRPGTKDSEKRPIEKDLEIFTGTNGVISLGYSEKKEDFVLTFCQQTNTTWTQPFSHHHQIEEGAARQVKKAHSPQNAIASFKQEDSFAATAMRFSKETSAEKIAKQYTGILSHEEGRNTAASKVIGDIPSKKKLEKQLSRRLFEMKKEERTEQKPFAEKKALERRIDFLQQEIRVEQQRNRKVQKAIRSRVDSIKKEKQKKEVDRMDWFVTFLKRQRLTEEEAMLQKEPSDNKIKNRRKSSASSKSNTFPK